MRLVLRCSHVALGKQHDRMGRVRVTRIRVGVDGDVDRFVDEQTCGLQVTTECLVDGFFVVVESGLSLALGVCPTVVQQQLCAFANEKA